MADSKTIKAADLAKVSAIDFVEQFSEDIRVLTEVLGLMRRSRRSPVRSSRPTR